MLRIDSALRVFIAPGVTDMRKSFDTLAGLVHDVLEQDPAAGHLFAFCNRARDRMKVLYWDGGGYCLLAKRLEKGRFAWPTSSASSGAVEMSCRELEELIGWTRAVSSSGASWYDWGGSNSMRAAKGNSRPAVHP